ncbi:hypothetical protein BYT27DRAFT_6389932 [Phlegmacium glaucopus]|nr:hypothetical protein BYT27DRAFT_6389932 [Phlegmacium glaucopus]
MCPTRLLFERVLSERLLFFIFERRLRRGRAIPWCVPTLTFLICLFSELLHVGLTQHDATRRYLLYLSLIGVRDVAMLPLMSYH